MASIYLETNVLPPIEIPTDPGTVSEDEGLLALIRPRISALLPVVGTVEYAPSGAPIPGLGAVVFYGVLILAALGAWGIVRRAF